MPPINEEARLALSQSRSDQISLRMQRQRTSGTRCELAVRRALHARGLRFRVDFRPLPNARTRVDIGWKTLKLAVFIDGCFWHACPQHFVPPVSNSAWWKNKLDSNTARDRRIELDLRQAGWTVLRFWEHEPPEVVARIIADTQSSIRRRC